MQIFKETKISIVNYKKKIFLMRISELYLDTQLWYKGNLMNFYSVNVSFGNVVTVLISIIYIHVDFEYVNSYMDYLDISRIFQLSWKHSKKLELIKDHKQEINQYSKFYNWKKNLNLLFNRTFIMVLHKCFRISLCPNTVIYK